MRKVTAQILGGQPRIVEATSVAEVMVALDLSGKYTIAVNGITANMEDVLPTTGPVFVSFAEAVKGA